MLRVATTRVADPAARRLVRDLGAIAALATERLALHVEERRHARAAANPPARARDVRWDATWKAAAVGAVAALPNDPLLTIVASAVEAGLLAHIEARASAKLLAIVSGPDDFDLPVRWNGEAQRAMFRAGAQKAMMLVAQHAARRIATTTLKNLGIALPRLAGRAVFGVVAPVASAAWSATWNALDMHRRLTPMVRAAEAQALAVHLRRAAPLVTWHDLALAPAAWPEATLAAA